MDAFTREQVRFARRLADVSRAMLSAAMTGPTSVDVKADRTYVTEVDRAIEARLRELIGHHRPGDGVLGEEYGSDNLGADVVWVLDPVDGTAPFIAGIPVFGTLIAATRHGKPWIGILDFPATGDRWIGVHGLFAEHNGVPVRTRRCDDLAAALVTCSNPDFLQPDEYAAFTRVRQRARYTLYGASAFAFGALASGRTDLAVDAGLKPYDVLAPAAVISGAGGVVTEWSGAELGLHASGRVVAAGDPVLHGAVLDLLAPDQAGARPTATPESGATP